MHQPKNVGFIVQWTTIDRQEFCDAEKNWYQIRQTETNDGKSLPTQIKLKIDKINFLLNPIISRFNSNGSN